MYKDNVLRRKRNKVDIELLKSDPETFWKEISIVGPACFVGNENLEEIVIPEGITEIGELAFKDCANLKKITLPTTLKKVGTGAFILCKKLQEIDLSHCQVDVIYNTTFQGCARLKKVKLGKHVKTILNHAFSFSPSLEEIDLEDSVEIIADHAFNACEKLQQIKGTARLKAIGNLAFTNCKKLRHIDLGKELNSIGSGAFLECIRLEEITIPNSVNQFGTLVFKDCKSLAKVEFQNEPNVIERKMFEGCIRLKDVVLPSSVEEIKEGAFAECEGLESIQLSKSLKRIGKNAFLKCSSLQKINLPQSIISIDYSAFAHCENLKEIIIPSIIYSIKYKTFEGCSKLKNVVLPENLLDIESGAFAGCVALEKITLPNSIVRICGFEGCSSLKQINIPNNVKYIEEKAFMGCSLTNLKLPQGVAEIGKSAFESCKKLTEVELGNEIKKIEDSTFKNCVSLVKLEIPASVKKINAHAFYGCKNLEKLTFNSFDIEFANDCFQECAFDFLVVDEKTSKTTFYSQLPNVDDSNVKIENLTEIKKHFVNFDYGVLLKKENREFLFKLVAKLDRLNVAIDFDFVKEFIKSNKTEQLLNDFDFRFLFEEIMFTNKGKNVVLSKNEMIFAKTIGAFSKKHILDKNGIPTNAILAQKASSLFAYLFSHKASQLASFTSCMKNSHIFTEPNQDLLAFLAVDDGKKTLPHISLLLSKIDETGSEFLSNIFLEFDLLKKCRFAVVDNKSKKLSWEKAIDRFILIKKFPSVKEKDYDIIELLSPFLDGEAINHIGFLRELAQEQGIPHHILKGPLKEKTIVESIEEIKNDTKEILVDTKVFLEKLYEKKFTYELLDKHDVRNAVLGLNIFCDCCAQISSACYGEEIARLTFLYPNVQNIVINDARGEPIAKATMAVLEKMNCAVINDFEINDKYKKHELELGGYYDVRDNHPDEIEREYIFKAMKRAVADFVKAYNEENPHAKIEKVVVGGGYNKLKKQLFSLEEEKDLIKIPDQYYFNDAKEQQYILYKAEKRKNENGED